MMNNDAKALTIYKGLLLLKSQRIHMVTLVGDFMVTLGAIINKLIPKWSDLACPV